MNLPTIIALLGFGGAVLRAAGQSLLPAAPADWQPGQEIPDTPPAAAGADGGQSFVCAFPAGADRHVWDLRGTFDLRAAAGVEFVYELDPPEVFRAVTWYLRRGSDWYAGLLPPGEGRRRAWLPRGNFEGAASPADWAKITGARLSPWSAGRGAGRITIYRAQALPARIAVVRPDDSVAPPAERAYGERAAAVLGALLDRLEIPYAVLRDRELADARLGAYALLALPYNPKPPAAEIAALRRYVERGGRLLVGYNTNLELARLMGVRPGRYLAAAAPGQWHGFLFEPFNWKGPSRVYQTETPNLLTAEPADAAAARVAAWWMDASGRRRPEAAWIASPQGLWFTHVLSGEDESAKARMLAALLEPYVPGVFAAGAAAALERSAARPGAAELRTELDAARAALATNAAAGWDAAARLDAELDRRAAAARPLPPGRRFVWDHSGNGLHGGNWRATARELAAAGIGEAFVFVPRGAPPPEITIRDAAAAGIKIHLWHLCWNLEGAPADRIRRYEADGLLQQSAAGGATPWLCPSRPANRAAERRRLEELAAAPGVAGVHLDYIRYPDDQHCYCPACRAAFAAAENVRPDPWPAAVREGELAARWRAWRARVITDFVADVARDWRTRHPGVELSAAVWPDYPAVADTLGQDWGAWLRAGWLDFVCPMNYTERTGELAAWVARQRALPGTEGKIVAGLGVTSAQTRLAPEQTLNQARAALAAGAAGFALFDLNQTLRREHFPILRAATGNADRGGAAGISAPAGAE